MIHCAMLLQTRVTTFIYIIIIDDENYYCRYPTLLLLLYVLLRFEFIINCIVRYTARDVISRGYTIIHAIAAGILYT